MKDRVGTPAFTSIVIGALGRAFTAITSVEVLRVRLGVPALRRGIAANPLRSPRLVVDVGGSAGGKISSASTSMTSVMTGVVRGSCNQRCAGEGSRGVALGRVAASASPWRKEEPAQPPKLGALDSLSVDSATERSKNGRVVVEIEGASLAGGKELRPRVWVGVVVVRFVQEAVGRRECPRRGESFRVFHGDRPLGTSFNRAASCARR